MPRFLFFWTPISVQKVEEHGLTTDDVEYVIQNPYRKSESRSSGDRLAEGYTEAGQWIVCIYRMLDPDMVEPITAFEPDEP
jgi:hypothetical protein